MAYAYAMEVEAAERYAELADQMSTHHNREVSELFAKLARIEGKHRDQILAKMGWTSPPEAAAARIMASRHFLRSAARCASTTAARSATS